ncbi:unnamed protein product [Sphagnum troendelagicum]|uniref:Uncharacterized protein n=1 Tax=Sphagnum troendelagicum TaxID=128251 RepID=A0ABP0UKS2_9BRYO
MCLPAFCSLSYLPCAYLDTEPLISLHQSHHPRGHQHWVHRLQVDYPNTEISIIKNVAYRVRRRGFSESSIELKPVECLKMLSLSRNYKPEIVLSRMVAFPDVMLLDFNLFVKTMLFSPTF